MHIRPASVFKPALSPDLTSTASTTSSGNLGDRPVKGGSPNEVKSSASNHPPPVSDSKSPASMTSRSVAAADPQTMTENVPETLPLPSEIPPVLEENLVWVQDTHGDTLHEMDPELAEMGIEDGLAYKARDDSQGARLVSVALGTLNETQAIHLCMDAVDKVFKPGVKPSEEEPMNLLKTLLEDLASAEKRPRKIAGVREGRDAQARLELVRLAVTCRAGKYLGVHNLDDAQKRTLEFYGREASPKPGAIELRVEAGLRFFLGHYETALRVPASPQQKVAKMLIVAMNQFASPRSAHAAVIEQINRFAESRKAEDSNVRMSDEAIQAERQALLNWAAAAIKRAEQSTA